MKVRMMVHLLGKPCGPVHKLDPRQIAQKPKLPHEFASLDFPAWQAAGKGCLHDLGTQKLSIHRLQAVFSTTGGVAPSVIAFLPALA